MFDQRNNFQANANTTANPVDQHRLAELIAAGELPFPAAGDTGELQQLAERVRALRRKKLLQFLARQVARTIARDRAAEPKGQMPC